MPSLSKELIGSNLLYETLGLYLLALFSRWPDANTLELLTDEAIVGFLSWSAEWLDKFDVRLGGLIKLLDGGNALGTLGKGIPLRPVF